VVVAADVEDEKKKRLMKNNNIYSMWSVPLAGILMVGDTF
jgi:hypothetical protein